MAERVSKEAEGLELGSSKTVLYLHGVGAEFGLEVGKVQNLRVAAQCLDGRVMRKGEVFSFWRHVPRPVRRNGFVTGRELRLGCVIPSVGGGLCQLTNALYDVALQAGFEIVERHAHSRKVPGAQGMEGRDATVFWNYLDLRFRPDVDCVLRVRLSEGELSVQVQALHAGGKRESLAGVPIWDTREAVESCETCGVVDCFRHERNGVGVEGGCRAWLVDAWSAEGEAYLAMEKREGDWLFAPLLERGAYRWKGSGWAGTRTEAWFVAKRSWVSRRLRGEGAERQRAMLELDAELAERYARRLPPEALHLVVSQTLLPHLWKAGALGGRSFDVLMSRMPMAALHRQLDRAATRWPGTKTLGDFRADSALLAAESEALAAAKRWITPHCAIAALGGERSVLLDWARPNVQARRGNAVVFPASTLSRKGARELREAIQGQDVTLRLLGPVLEEDGFWNGMKVQQMAGDWLDGAGVVVLPAWVEHQPRRLLRALAAGIPVVCTSACGIAARPGLTLVEEGDVAGLRAAIRTALASGVRE